MTIICIISMRITEKQAHNYICTYLNSEPRHQHQTDLMSERANLRRDKWVQEAITNPVFLMSKILHRISIRLTPTDTHPIIPA